MEVDIDIFNMDEDLEEPGYYDDEDDEWDFENEICIRAKWSMDGASTLAEAALMLQGYAQELLDFAVEGWELTQPVEDDYGFLRKLED